MLARRYTSPLTTFQLPYKAAIRDGDPSILLGKWISPNVLHWVVGIGYGNDALLAMDPWTGMLTAYRWRVVALLATGDVVQVIR